MASTKYLQRRNELEDYFDRTASKAWERLTSDAPVSRIRSKVRAGRDNTRDTLLSWLPEDLRGARVLDAGCGPGQLALVAAARGADVLAVDLSKSLLDVATERAASLELQGSVKFVAGDMLNPPETDFDYVVAMDSVIHYQSGDFKYAVDQLVSMSRKSCLFTFAPRTPLLSVALAAGQVFPRGDRSPAIEPHSEAKVRKALSSYKILNSKRIKSSFYTSHAMEISR